MKANKKKYCARLSKTGDRLTKDKKNQSTLRQNLEGGKLMNQKWKLPSIRKHETVMQLLGTLE